MKQSLFTFDSCTASNLEIYMDVAIHLISCAKFCDVYTRFILCADFRTPTANAGVNLVCADIIIPSPVLCKHIELSRASFMIFIDNFIATVYYAVLSGYITTLKNKQKLDVSLLTLDEGPSLETSSFCLFFKVVI